MLLGARTAAWGGKALPYDEELEWISSLGVACVDTDCILKSTTYFKLVVNMYKTTSTCSFCGNEDSTTYQNNVGSYMNTDGSFYLRNGKSAQTQSLNKSVDHTIRFENWAHVDSSSYDTMRWNGTFTNERHFWLFTSGYNGVPRTWDRSFSSIKYFECTDGEEVVSKMIPVLKDGVPYFFDIKRPTGGPNGNGLFGNYASSGVFGYKRKNGEEVDPA